MKWILPITGFTESASYPTGVESIWRRTLRPFHADDLIILRPETWGADMRELAIFIARNSSTRARVMVVAYSWGAGVGFTSFAWAAHQLGIQIEIACLCDPVFRSRLLPSWLPLNLLSLFPIGPSIRIAPSVQRVEWVRQRNSLPAGHDLEAADPQSTQIRRPTILSLPHHLMDESEAFRMLVAAEAEKFANLLPRKCADRGHGAEIREDA